VGNYLACEICAHAGIHPLRLCKDLNENDFKKILSGIKLSLSKSLKNGGATFHGGYQDAHGDKGEGLKTLVVFYQKVCGLCKKMKVEKIYLDGRGTYFCPVCQS
jgi:formamidopyrimidine-DNA glycosylase